MIIRRDFLASAFSPAIAMLASEACTKTHPSASLIRVCAYPSVALSGLYLANERGYFSQEGLKVEILEIINKQSTLVLLGTGRADASFTAVTPGLVNAIAKGAKIRIVAGRETINKTCGSVGKIYGRRTSFPRGLGDLKELKGKRISVRLKASISEFFLDCLLATAGLSSQDVELVALTESEAAAALVAGKIDALISSFFDRNLESGEAHFLEGPGMSDILPGLQYSFIFFGPSLLDGERSKGMRFLKGYLRGTAAFLAGETPKYLDTLAGEGKLDRDRVITGCRETMVRDGQIVADSVDRFVRWAVKKEYCDRELPASQMIDSSFLPDGRSSPLS